MAFMESPGSCVTSTAAADGDSMRDNRNRNRAHGVYAGSQISICRMTGSFRRLPIARRLRLRRPASVLSPRRANRIADMATAKRRRAPRQDRSRITVDAIFEATARVVAKDGIAGLRIADVARVAGVSKGSIYQYFPTREALVTGWESHLFEQRAVALGGRLMQLLAQPGIRFEEAIPEVVENVMTQLAEHVTLSGHKGAPEHPTRPWIHDPRVERIEALIVTVLQNSPGHARLRPARLDIAARVMVRTVLHLGTQKGNRRPARPATSRSISAARWRRAGSRGSYRFNEAASRSPASA